MEIDYISWKHVRASISYHLDFTSVFGTFEEKINKFV